MRPVMTGKACLNGRDAALAAGMLEGRIKQKRFVLELELLAVAAAGQALDGAGVSFPVGRTDMGIFIGIDNCIEDIKDNYFINILSDGILGTSPMIFPFTTPNSLSAQVAAAFDIRGESITFAVNQSFDVVLEYTTDCIISGYVGAAVAGLIRAGERDSNRTEDGYYAEFYIVEDFQTASRRGARVLGSV